MKQPVMRCGVSRFLCCFCFCLRVSCHVSPFLPCFLSLRFDFLHRFLVVSLTFFSCGLRSIFCRLMVSLARTFHRSKVLPSCIMEQIIDAPMPQVLETVTEQLQPPWSRLSSKLRKSCLAFHRSWCEPWTNHWEVFSPIVWRRSSSGCGRAPLQ